MQDASDIVAQLREQNQQLLAQNQTLTQTVASLTAQMDRLTAEMARIALEAGRWAAEVRRLTDPADPAGQFRQQNHQLMRQVAELTSQVARLTEQLSEAQAAVARQAGPFRRAERLKKPVEQHKKSGRPVGHVGACRQAPPVDHREVVPLPCCPKCGGNIRGVYPVRQIIEEIPPIRPVVYEVVTYRAMCACCGDVCSRHPLQTSDATGAAGVHLGPRAIALAAVLNKHHGLTMRRTCTVLRELTGLRLTPGGLSQAVARLAGRVADDYDALINRIRGSPVVNADETSWWVGGPGWWLWTFTCPEVTVYRVDERRSGEVVKEMLGEDFAGVLVSDCLSSYDRATYRKHKCIAHHLRAIEAALRLEDARTSEYLAQWKKLFKSVIVVHRLWEQKALDDADVAARRIALEAWVDQLLAQQVAPGGETRIQNRLAKQRQHLLGCLKDVRVEPTNNRAERALRPAVITRKLSCGNKTDQGRRTWETLASLAATAHQTGQDFTHYLATHAALIHNPKNAG